MDTDILFQVATDIGILGTTLEQLQTLTYVIVEDIEENKGNPDRRSVHIDLLNILCDGLERVKRTPDEAAEKLMDYRKGGRG